MLIQPKKEIVVNKRALAEVEGIFRVQIRKADGSVRWDSGFYRNLVLDTGLNLIAERPTPWCGWCFIGTDGTPPSVGQSSLLGFAARTSTIVNTEKNSQVVTQPYYGWLRQTFRFPQGSLAGNYSEVGVGDRASSVDYTVSRALIIDPINNQPTTITVLPDEFVDVTWEWRIYAPTNDVIGPPVTIDGETYDTITRASSIGDRPWYFDLDHQVGPFFGQNEDNHRLYAGTLGTVLQAPNGTSTSLAWSQLVAGSYSTNSYERLFSLIIPDIEGNDFPIRSVVIATTMGAYQTQFTGQVSGAGIAKNNTFSLTLNFLLDWARRP